MPSSIHSPGVTWHSVRSRTCGSMSGSGVRIVFCQNVPASTVNSPARTPAPSSPSWVYAPPAATGAPGRRAGRAACLVRARPQLPAAGVGEDAALAHAGRGPRHDLVPGRVGQPEGIPDARRDREPVRLDVEVLAAGHAGRLPVGPFPERDRG